MAQGAATGEARAVAPVPALPRVDAQPTAVRIPLGWRVMVVSDLRLRPEPAPFSPASAGEIAGNLRDWTGPGVLVICGGLFDPPETDTEDLGRWVEGALAAHTDLRDALRAFAAVGDRRILLIPSPPEAVMLADGAQGTGDGPHACPAVRKILGQLGIELAPSIHLHAATAVGERVVVLRAGPPSPAPARPEGSQTAGGAVGTPASEQQRWLAGMDRLERPSSSESFVTSRTLYRRLGRYAWWLLVPVMAALLLRLPFVLSGLTHLFGNAPGPKHALARAHNASWGIRLVVAGGITLVELLVLALVLAVLSRRVWVALGGQRLPPPWRRGQDRSGDAQLDPELDEARALVATGAAGLIEGGNLRAQLVHLGTGFYATPGGTTEVVREHRGRVGLAPVFLPYLQVAFVEIETGADLHVRLMRAEAGLPNSTRLERMVSAEHVVKGRKPGADLHPAMVASWPRGAPWPPPPDRSGERQRARRVRRIAAAAIFLAGLVDLLVAVSPPLRADLHLVTRYLPLGVSEAAGALVALAGIGLMMLARGILRGQHRPWQVAILLLSGSAVLHLVRSADVISIVLSLGVVTLLLVERRWFRAATDTRSARSAATTVVLGAVVAVAFATLAAEIAGGVRRQALPGAPWVALAAAERLVGLHTIAMPDTVNDFMGPSMLAVGCAAGGRLPVPRHPTGGGSRPLRDLGGVDPQGGRAPRPRHRPAARDREPRLLRPPRRQALVLPPRRSRGLRGVWRNVPRVSRPHRPRGGAHAHLAGVPPLCRPPRLGRGHHRRIGGVAPHLPQVGDAPRLYRRRGPRRRALLLVAGGEDEGPAAGLHPALALRLSGRVPRPRRPWDRTWPRPSSTSWSASGEGRPSAAFRCASDGCSTGATRASCRPWSSDPTASPSPCASSSRPRASAATPST